MKFIKKTKVIQNRVTVPSPIRLLFDIQNGSYVGWNISDNNERIIVIKMRE